MVDRLRQVKEKTQGLSGRLCSHLFQRWSTETTGAVWEQRVSVWSAGLRKGQQTVHNGLCCNLGRPGCLQSAFSFGKEAWSRFVLVY